MKFPDANEPSEILPAPKHVASPSGYVDELLEKVREGERRFPNVPKFNESSLPPRDFSTWGEELAWTAASLRIVDEHLRRNVEHLDADLDALARAWPPAGSS